MKKLYTALITPFTITNDIDYPALDKIILRLLDEKVVQRVKARHAVKMKSLPCWNM